MTQFVLGSAHQKRRREMDLLGMLFIIVFGALVATLLVNDIAVRRTRPTCFLFGLSAKKTLCAYWMRNR